MPSSVKKKPYATTASSTWATKGTVPEGELATGYQIDSSGTTCIVEATSNPGVDPVDAGLRPQIRKGVYIHANDQLRLVTEVYPQHNSAQLRFTTDRAFNPVLTNQVFNVVKREYKLVSIANIGGVDGTIDEETFIADQTATWPNESSDGVQNSAPVILYDATGTEFAIQVE